jgi:hypothetical protein
MGLLSYTSPPAGHFSNFLSTLPDLVKLLSDPVFQPVLTTINPHLKDFFGRANPG